MIIEWKKEAGVGERGVNEIGAEIDKSQFNAILLMIQLCGIQLFLFMTMTCFNSGTKWAEAKEPKAMHGLRPP